MCMQIEDAHSVCEFLLLVVTVLTGFIENSNRFWKAEAISKENEQVVFFFFIMAVF